MKAVFIFIMILAVSLVFADTTLNKIKEATVKDNSNDNSSEIRPKKMEESKNTNPNISLGIENTTEVHSIKVKRK
jgi:hypothetical protein